MEKTYISKGRAFNTNSTSQNKAEADALNLILSVHCAKSYTDVSSLCSDHRQFSDMRGMCNKMILLAKMFENIIGELDFFETLFSK